MGSKIYQRLQDLEELTENLLNIDHPIQLISSNDTYTDVEINDKPQLFELRLNAFKSSDVFTLSVKCIPGI